jgi:hypothetical protein
MKKLIAALSLCSVSLISYAQQDLRDISYIYSLDESNRQARNIAYNMNRTMLFIKALTRLFHFSNVTAKGIVDLPRSRSSPMMKT